jgi:hypothetical protein
MESQFYKDFFSNVLLKKVAVYFGSKRCVEKNYDQINAWLPKTSIAAQRLSGSVLTKGIQWLLT